jgi:hypothetical protein
MEAVHAEAKQKLLRWLTVLLAVGAGLGYLLRQG